MKHTKRIRKTALEYCKCTPLIEQFIGTNLKKTQTQEEVLEEFDKYWEDEKVKAVNSICSDEKLDKKRIKALLDDMAFRRKQPLREDIFKTMIDKPKLLERDSAHMRLNQVVSGFVETFFSGM